ncbi:MAG: glycosyltransferase family 39 protein [Acidobacteriota bacterium]|nr:glycosyltransferase family 39 protein [Acidobacteriota bacterium]
MLITEMLSVPRLVTRGGVAACWAAVCVICAIVYLKSASTTDLSRNSHEGLEPDDEQLDMTTRLLLGAAGIIIAMVGITALLAPPSGIDGMTYHLPRVAMWIQNHNVRFFPTRNYTQLIYGAFAEYSMMHTNLLWGSDRFVNLVQFFSFVGCGIAVSYIVKILGGGRRAQALAFLVSITIPEGILEASGPMNTYVTSFWIATTTAFLLALNEDGSWLNTIGVGLAAGLAIFTKGTTYIVLPFFVVICWWIGTRASRILFLKRCAAMVALILAINGPQYLRNYEFDGSPLGVPLNYGQLQLTVQDIGVRSTLANILRNISFHTTTPVESVNLKIERGYRASMRGMGVDPDDPRQVIWEKPFVVNHLSFQELLAGNPFHFILLLVALGIVFVKFRSAANGPVFWYATGMTAAFVAFCAILKWQRWSSRFHLPFFVMGAVIVALAFTRYVPRKVITAAGILLVSWGLINGAMNRYRSLLPMGRWESAYLPRKQMYFAYELDYLAASYIAAAETVNKTNCTSVGIDSYTELSDPEIKDGPDSFITYPLFAMIHADGQKRQAWFSGVQNLTARFAEQQPHAPACAIICLDCAKVPAKFEEYSALPNRAMFDGIVVFTEARRGSAPK